jgi:hypothetical protein
MSNKIVTTFELSRGVAKHVDPGNTNMPRDVSRVMSTLIRFVSNTFTKTRHQVRGEAIVSV